MMGVTVDTAIETLDKYSLGQWLDTALFFGIRSPYSIITHLNTWYDNQELHDAINELTIEQFMEYLSSRYGVKWQKEIHYRCYKDA